LSPLLIDIEGGNPYLDSMIRLRPNIIPFLFIAIVYPLLYSCAKSEETLYGDSLYIADYQSPSIINPILTIGTVSLLLSEMIFDGLISFDEALNPIPNLASSWETLDNGSR
jgi:ABC-type transport system substrate-binding protein